MQQILRAGPQAEQLATVTVLTCERLYELLQAGQFGAMRAGIVAQYGR